MKRSFPVLAGAVLGSCKVALGGGCGGSAMCMVGTALWPNPAFKRTQLGMASPLPAGLLN